MSLRHFPVRDSNGSLVELLRTELRGLPVIAVSNREPYIHRRNGGEIECIRPASGLTVALDRRTLLVKVLELGTRRGPAVEARQLYADLDSDDGTLVTSPDSG